MKPLYNVFITHAWRYHADWTKAGELLEADRDVTWRNFSVPWYDPAFDPNTPLGKTHLHAWLESQIQPVDVVLLLAGVYGVKSSRKWLDLELEMARGQGKPVFVLPPIGREEVAPDVAALGDAVVLWHAESIRVALDGRRKAA
ncbi:MAG TPA: TIR domain-containing protein [Azospirillum sp.]